MLWAIFPIIAQFFYTSVGYIQNFLTDCALPKKRAGALTIAHFPCFLLIIILLLAIFGRTVFILPLPNAIGLIIAGSINVFGSVYCYKAYQEGDTADVAIIGQLSPLISLGLGVLILGETVTVNQGIGLLLIMAAAFLIVFGGTSKKEREQPNIKVAIYTIISMFFSTLSDVVYVYALKGFTTDIYLLGRGLFFFFIGSILTVTVFFICRHSWRRAIKTTFFTGRKHSRNSFILLCEGIAIILAEFIFKYGLIIVPVIAMMTAVSKVAGLFLSLFFTIFLGRIFPKFIHGKRLTKKILMQYLIASVMIVSGVMIMT